RKEYDLSHERSAITNNPLYNRRHQDNESNDEFNPMAGQHHFNSLIESLLGQGGLGGLDHRPGRSEGHSSNWTNMFGNNGFSNGMMYSKSSSYQTDANGRTVR